MSPTSTVDPPSFERTTTLHLDHTGGPVDVRVQEHDHCQPFLLLHGGAGPASFAPFADLLSARMHRRVILPTHPGFDGTPRPESLHSIGGLAQLYVALLDQLGLTDVTVLGNSIGGWIAAEIALLNSPRVSGAILVDAVGITVEDNPVTDVSELTPTEIRALSWHNPDSAPQPPQSGPPLATDFEALAVYGGKSMEDPTLRERLAELDLPVHVIWGESDRIVDPFYGEAYAAAIPGAHFTRLPAAGHLPQLEAPEELLGAIWDLGND
jgi:pimeloyl-ACP methyl ester carboxylesterase